MKTLSRFIIAGAFALSTSGALADSPAAIAPSDPSFERAETAFQSFAEDWMKKMGAAAANEKRNAKGGAYRGYGEAFKIELKPTGSTTAPYVGLLRYEEHKCAADGGAACQIAGTTAVTEIFRFQGGRWVY